MTGGTGQKFEAATTVIAGVASLAATLLSIVYANHPEYLLGTFSISVYAVCANPVRLTGQYGYKRKERYN